MNYKPYCNTEISFLKLTDLKQKLLTLKTNNILLLMTESMANRINFKPFIQEWTNQRTLTWIKNIPANPTSTDILTSLQQLEINKPDIIIAIGGGSVIDLAKAISAFSDQKKHTTYTAQDIKNDIIQKNYIKGQFIDIIAIPSTAGTGSELTQWATIWDENKQYKYSIDTKQLKPKQALIIPDLTLSMKPDLTLTTGLDSMCQAIEAYWSKHTTPLVQEMAYRSIQLTIENLRHAVDNPDDLPTRENLCNASVLSALAFSQTRTTACHSISYPLTMMFDIPHGLAAAITLDAVGQTNKNNFPNDRQLFKLFDKYNGIKNYIDTTCKGIINMRLSSFGVKETDIPKIVDKAFTGGRMDNNPVDLTKEDVYKVLRGIL